MAATEQRMFDRRAVSARSSPSPLTDEQLAALAEVGAALGIQDAAVARAEADAAMAALLLVRSMQFCHVSYRAHDWLIASLQRIRDL